MSPAPCAAIFGCLGTGLSPSEFSFFREADPWGFILFARNISDPVQVLHLTSALREAVGRDAPVFVDQEGGRVQRLRAPHWTEWAPPLEMVAEVMAKAQPGQQLAGARRAMWLRYRLIAAELRAVGIDGNCAPCLDVATSETHGFLRNRCYSDKPASVTALGRAVAAGLLAGGVLPVAKHIPGHGRGTIDSHHDLPVVTTPYKVLEQNDFIPFRDLTYLPLAMTAHVVYTSIDPDRPATTSPRMIAVIRDKIGFDGLLMSDDLSMNALCGSVAERTTATIAAGVDIALHCNGEPGEMEAVTAAAGRLTANGQKRAEHALAARKAPEPVDMAVLRAEFSGLLNGQGHG